MILGKTNLLQMSAALPAWTTIATNVLPVNALSNRFQFTDTFPTATANRFYRVLQLP